MTKQSISGANAPNVLSPEAKASAIFAVVAFLTALLLIRVSFGWKALVSNVILAVLPVVAGAAAFSIFRKLMSSSRRRSLRSAAARGAIAALMTYLAASIVYAALAAAGHYADQHANGSPIAIGILESLAVGAFVILAALLFFGWAAAIVGAVTSAILERFVVGDNTT